jgi:hexosaminidase
MEETKHDLDILPKPVSLQYGDGFFTAAALPLIEGDDSFRGEMALAREQLARDFGDTPAAQGPRLERVSCRRENQSREGAYRISLSPGGIGLYAAGGKGMYHGLQSLRQILLSSYRHGRFSIPAAEIADYPRFPWRGFMLDTSRHFYSLRFIKKIIDLLSLHHLSVFHWHLTDDQGWRLPVPEYPLLTELGSRRENARVPGRFSGGFYREEEIRDLVAYAAERHIEVVPEVDLPGHASAILAAYPNLGCSGGPYRVEDRFGIFEDVLCAGNDGIFDLAAAVFDTLVRLFPSPYVHIGGDEVLFNRWEACPKCRARLAETGLTKPRELQSWITAKLVDMLSRRGRTAIGWDEVLEDSEQYPLPPETVVMSWRGAGGGRTACARGHRVVMSPNTQGCYLDYRHNPDPEEPGQRVVSSVFQGYNLEPLPPELSGGGEGLILGGQGNLWSELIEADRIAEYMIFPRICALAEALWSPRETRDFADFARRLRTHQKRLHRLGLIQYRGPLGEDFPDTPENPGSL